MNKDALKTWKNMTTIPLSQRFCDSCIHSEGDVAGINQVCRECMLDKDKNAIRQNPWAQGPGTNWEWDQETK